MAAGSQIAGQGRFLIQQFQRWRWLKYFKEFSG
jgi:hypothetical protein